jgi:hypothetical protein
MPYTESPAKSLRNPCGEMKPKAKQGRRIPRYETARDGEMAVT